ncbi:hypothetical protein MMC24_003712 [Lignoscripta atroalba]|nr:hypothetical protein [Lignoscripta atroalba]
MATTSLSSNYRKSSDYPKPLIVPPAGEHRQTIILLHGRGSSAAKFGPQILATEIPDLGTLSDAFPHAKFVFPTASRRRAIIYNRTPINQWFDNWSLETPTGREELQIDGLRETSAYIHELLKEEIDLVGAKNIVLGGLSQGCAATLVSLLTWDGEPLAAAVGMCGWLPFRKHLEDIARNTEYHEDEGDDPFAHSDEDDNLDSWDEELRSRDTNKGATSKVDQPTQAVAYLREELEIPVPSLPMSFQRIPLFLSHGMEDGKVFVHLGREAASCLSAMAIDVLWKEYQGLGHWYSEDMLHDMVNFVRQRPGWAVGKDAVNRGIVDKG